MTDNDLRLERLEASLRRLRATVAVLGVTLVAVISMAAAPSAPTDLKVRRLSASEIVLEDGKDKLSMTPGSLVVARSAERAELSPTSMRLSNANLQVELEISDASGHVSVMTLEKTKLPASAELSVNAVPNQLRTPFVMVNDGDRQAALFPTGLLPPPR